jgi:hypothetical protein
MRNLKLISILLFTFFAFSCKKDKTSTTNKQAELTVYKNTANSNDELMATYYDPNTSSTSYIYGSTNSVGRGTVAKSMVYEREGNDTLINIILDADSRPFFLYASTRSGVKINQLFKFEYVNGDSIKVSFYKYNWLDGTDSLMAQYVSKDNNGRTLYGARVAATNVEGEWLLSISVGITIGVLCPIAAGYIVGFELNGGAISGILTALATAYSIWSGTANGATLSNNLPPYPTSPTNPNGNTIESIEFYTFDSVIPNGKKRYICYWYQCELCPHVVLNLENIRLTVVTTKSKIYYAAGGLVTSEPLLFPNCIYPQQTFPFNFSGEVGNNISGKNFNSEYAIFPDRYTQWIIYINYNFGSPILNIKVSSAEANWFLSEIR